MNEKKLYKLKFNNLIIFIDIILIIFGIYIIYKGLINNKLIIALLIDLILFIFLTYLNILNKKTDFLFTDIRFPLITGYLLYNLYTPILFCLDKSSLLLYPKVDNQFQQLGYIFSKEDLNKSLFISILFMLGLLLSLIFAKKGINNVNNFITKNTVSNKSKYYNRKFIYWLSLFIVSFLWYIYPYFKLGIGALEYGRWFRYSVLFEDVRESLGVINSILRIFTNSYLVLISLFQMYICSIRSKKKTIKSVFIVIFSLYIFFMLFIDIRRRELLIVILMMICFYLKVIKEKVNIITLKKQLRNICLILIVIGSLFFVYQYYKNYFQYGYKNGISQMMELKRNEHKDEYDKYSNEFGLVYLVNLSNSKYLKNFLYGKSYFEAFIRPIPILNKTLWTWFQYDKEDLEADKILKSIYPGMFQMGGGLGYSPSIEAYSNFSYVGCILMGIIIGGLFNIIYKKFLNNKYIVYYCIIFSVMFNFSRTSFLGLTEELFWLFSNYLFYQLIFQLINKKIYSLK
ncbi:Uncharacterised protein [Clostridium fallax]|nr:O-antigen polymerase [Clostridium fallax]SQB06286.1 Uncharacterised protein [Clostridium fallax]